jgi:hypothetical protein
VRSDLAFALAALVPAAFNPSPAPAAMLVALCTGDGATHAILIPLPGHPLPGAPGQSCCAKGCHAGARRRGTPQKPDVDPAQ